MATTRPTVFVSHSTADDDFVRELSRALENLQQPVWIDSRPVLFQEKEDPQLFRRLPSQAVTSITEELRCARYGELPKEPATGFIGRSRELLALQRLLRPQHSAGRIANPSYLAEGRPRWAVVRGNGGEGKTALAVELAHWLVRSHQMDRAAFVSVEIDTNAAAVVNALGISIFYCALKIQFR